MGEAEEKEVKLARSELRATSAFTLGVLGGSQALERLERSLGDPHDNTRYNAAIGLARHGVMAAIPTLVEMLDQEQSS